MKKTLIAFAAAAALTTSAFAEITFGAWIRAVTVPLASNGDDTVATMTSSWGGDADTARFTVHGKAEDGNAGFDMGVYNKASMELHAGDEAVIWLKPVDVVKLSMGKYDNNTLRGDYCYGQWDFLRSNAWIAGDEGLLMTGNGKTGFLAEITPMDNLYIQALIPVTKDTKKAEEIYKNVQAGAAYTIDGVGKIKAQFLGDFTAKDEATNTDAVFNKTLEAEFDLTAVENLWLGLGFQYNMYDGDAKYSTFEGEEFNAKQAMKIALGAKYQVSDMIGLSASAAFFTYNKIDTWDLTVDPRFQAGVGVNAAVADGVNVSADVRYLSAVKIDGEKDDPSGEPFGADRIAASVGVTKTVSSNGFIGAAFEVATHGGFANIDAAKDDDGVGKTTWCVPVVFQVSF